MGAIRSIAETISAVFIPAGCLSCGQNVPARGQGGICAACWQAMPQPAPVRCFRCDLPLDAPGVAQLPGGQCGRCLVSPPAFDALRTAAPFTATARTILHAFKFHGADYLAPHLARALAARLDDLPSTPQAVVPVPATRREKRVRRFFPAGELAAEVSLRTAIPYEPARLSKVRQTRRQVGLPLRERHENVRRAFAAYRPPQVVLLVDDVATSGATLSECARALKAAGARTVFAAAFARALPEGN